MEITYDKAADALYIAFGKGKFFKNKKLDNLTILDLDAKGKLLGIELLNVRKRTPARSLSQINVKNLLVAAK
ncbi:MAG: DUF2283 domain-containing protein [Candidatus Diapherotrites archaeon]|nr:DUF2283 domain-containing protein [Candidatus Diapherotrites archaeon]